MLCHMMGALKKNGELMMRTLLYVAFVMMVSTSSYARMTCSALCGYYDFNGETHLFLNPEISREESMSSAVYVWNGIDNDCKKKVEKELGVGVQHVLLRQVVTPVSATNTKIDHLIATAIQSCRKF